MKSFKAHLTEAPGDWVFATIQKIPQQTQAQYDTNTQLKFAKSAALRLGLYDAADAIDKLIRW